MHVFRTRAMSVHACDWNLYCYIHFKAPADVLSICLCPRCLCSRDRYCKLLLTTFFRTIWTQHATYGQMLTSFPKTLKPIIKMCSIITLNLRPQQMYLYGLRKLWLVALTSALQGHYHNSFHWLYSMWSLSPNLILWRGCMHAWCAPIALHLRLSWRRENIPLTNPHQSVGDSRMMTCFAMMIMTRWKGHKHCPLPSDEHLHDQFLDYRISLSLAIFSSSLVIFFHVNQEFFEATVSCSPAIANISLLLLLCYAKA